MPNATEMVVAADAHEEPLYGAYSPAVSLRNRVHFPKRPGMVMESAIKPPEHTPWNKGKLVGQKAPLRLRDIWAIRVRLQLAQRTRDLALFNLAIDSKLRACDLVKLRVNDVCHGEPVASRAIVMQQKTQRPVQFEITDQTRDSTSAWMTHAHLRA